MRFWLLSLFTAITINSYANNDTLYAYIINSGNNTYTSCSNGITSDCQSNTLANSSNPGLISIVNNYAYIINSNNSVTICNSGNGQLNGCINTKIKDNDGHTITDHLNGIAINNGYAYFSNYIANDNGVPTNTNIVMCSVSNAVFSNCKAYPLLNLGFDTSLNQIAINNGYLYATTFSGSGSPNMDNNYIFAQINSQTGALENITHYPIKKLGFATQIIINNGYAYILNIMFGPSTYGYYLQCKIDPITAKFDNCPDFIPGGTSNPLLPSPMGMAINNDYAYITNSNNNLSQCEIDSTTGNLINCELKTLTNLNQPYGIAFSN